MQTFSSLLASPIFLALPHDGAGARGRHSMTIPMARRARVDSHAHERMAAAIDSAAASRQMPMAALRQAANTCGPLPRRIRHASSPKLTSRTKWLRFSIAQCPRVKDKRRAGVARLLERLVIPSAISKLCLLLGPRQVSRSRRKICFAPGKSMLVAPMSAALIRRISMRPCPLSLSVCTGGKSRHRRVLDFPLHRWLVAFHYHDVISCLDLDDQRGRVFRSTSIKGSSGVAIVAAKHS